jgi:hypothetical protein
LYIDVIQAIKDNAFKASPYPVILSLENHCDIVHQKRMVEIMKEIFGDMIYIPTSFTGSFPSPENLKNKIILKGKRLPSPGPSPPSPPSPNASDKLHKPNNLSNKIDNSTELTIDAVSSQPQSPNEQHSSTPHKVTYVGMRAISNEPFPVPKVHHPNSSPDSKSNPENVTEDRNQNKTLKSFVSAKSMFSLISFGSNKQVKVPLLSSSPSFTSPQSSPRAMELQSPTSPAEDGEINHHFTPHSSRINIDSEEGEVAPELSELISLSGEKIKNFDGSEELKLPTGTCASFVETKVNKFCKTSESTAKWISYNQKYFSRIYPAGSRIDSSNYDPGEAWSAGAHMVALNYQTNDLHKHFNFGKFRENGQCGYILKPSYLLSRQPINMPSPIKLTIHLISGHQLPKPRGAQYGEIIDPFVAVTITGAAVDYTKWKTKTISDNGINPIWNEVIIYNVCNTF